MITLAPSPFVNRATGDIQSAPLEYNVESCPPAYWKVIPTGCCFGLVASYCLTKLTTLACHELEYGAPASFDTSYSTLSRSFTESITFRMYACSTLHTSFGIAEVSVG